MRSRPFGHRQCDALIAAEAHASKLVIEKSTVPTFKANTDDIRFAPSLGVIERLLARETHPACPANSFFRRCRPANDTCFTKGGCGIAGSLDPAALSTHYLPHEIHLTRGAEIFTAALATYLPRQLLAHEPVASPD